MNKEMLESGEFYKRRYSNFSTLIIIPTLIFIAFIVLFSFIGKKELTVTTIGEIVPSDTISIIQSTSNNTIIANELYENKFVGRGERLVVYDNERNEIEFDTLRAELNQYEDRLKQIELLRKGIQNNSNSFTNPDNFGYYQKLQYYLSQISILKQDIAKENQNIQNRKQVNKNIINSIDSQINQVNTKLKEYRELRLAIHDNLELTKTNSLISIFDDYRSQLANTLKKNELKKRMITEMDQNISQLKVSLKTLYSNKNNSMSDSEITSSLSTKIEALKAEYLSSVGKDYVEISTNIMELKMKLSLLRIQIKNTVIVSDKSGVIHINEDVTGMKNIPIGTRLAEIYPSFSKKKKFNVESYVSTSDIISLKIGMNVRLKIKMNVPKPLNISGNVISIDVTPTHTKKGNYYKVVSEMTVHKKDLGRIRYGLQGKTVIIVGKKTFFDYFKDMLMQ